MLPLWRSLRHHSSSRSCSRDVAVSSLSLTPLAASGACRCSFDTQEGINVFETTIRVVGGLCGAYELSGNATFLHRAVELADRLLAAFDT
jgi:hypothetical protein